MSDIAYGGQAYSANLPAENAGLFHKGDCSACSFNSRGYLCKVRPSAKEVAENFVVSGYKLLSYRLLSGKQKDFHS